MRNAIWVVILIILTMAACGDDTQEKTEYKDGVIVVNQGPFQTGSGSLTFKSRDGSPPVLDVFTLSNNGAFLGNIAQSMIEFEGKNYISINNGGKIVVTDNDDFTFLDTIGGIFQSRYFASNGDKLYVSAWGMTGSSGRVQELNTDQNSIQMAFALGNGPEGMEFVDNLLYVAKGGGFLSDSTLVIIDTENDVVIEEITVGDNPEYMVKDEEDNIYLICNGITNFSDPSLSTPGKLLKIKNQEILWSYDLPNGSNRLAIDKDNGFLYFNMNGKVVKQSINNESLDEKVIYNGTASALGFDDSQNQLYIGDAKDFQSQGEVYIYSDNDALVDSFSCGIIPSYFHFK